MNPIVALPGIMPVGSPVSDRQIFADHSGGWRFDFIELPQGDTGPVVSRLERVHMDDQVVAALDEFGITSFPVNGRIIYSIVADGSQRETRAYRGDTIFHLHWSLDGSSQKTKFIVRQKNWLVPPT